MRTAPALEGFTAPPPTTVARRTLPRSESGSEGAQRTGGGTGSSEPLRRVPVTRQYHRTFPRPVTAETLDSRLAAGRLIVALLIFGLAAPAHADPRTDARDRLEEGSALYRKGDYQGALQKFEEARALFPSPKIYFNLGQALNRLGRTAGAVDAFEKFLAEAPDAAPERRRDAETLLNELRPRIGYVRVTAEPGSEIAVDGQPAGTAPLRRTVAVDPGLHQLTARAPGARIGHVGTVEVAPGQTVEWEAKEAPTPLADGPLPLAVKAEPPPSALAQAPPPEPARRRWLPWAAGAAVVVTGMVVTGLLLSGGSDNPKGSLGFWDRR